MPVARPPVTREPSPRPEPAVGSGLRALLDLSPVPMWVQDDETGRFLDVNESALRCYSYSRAQFLAMTIAEIDAAPPGQAASDEPYPVRHHRRADSTLIPVWLQTSGIAVDGRAASLVVSIDLTAQNRALAESERRCRALTASESALRRSEAQFRRLFETTSDWYWEHDPKGRITFVSLNFEITYGIPIREILGKRLNDLPHATVDPESGQRALAAIQARQPYRDLLYSHALPDGRTVYVRTSAVPMFDSDGDFRGYCGVSKDVTAQTEADRALRESEQQIRAVLEAATDSYWEGDTKYRYTYVSDSYAKMLDTTPAEMIGKRFSDLPGLSVDPQMGKMTLSAQAAKQPYRDFVYARTTADGSKRWFKSSGAPIFDRNGVFKGYRGVTAEITHSVEAEAAARLAQQHLHEAVAHVTQPIVVYGADDRVVAFNQAFVDLHMHKLPKINARIWAGLSFREIAEWQLGAGLYATAPDVAPVDIEMLLAHYGTGEERIFQLRDGCWVQVVYHRLPGGGRIGLWTDVTALKRAEAERRALEIQLHHSQRLESLGTLAGGVAHEINNALVPVIALTKVTVGKLAEGSRERRNLEIALSGAERSRDLVKQILAFSRKENEARPRESVDMAGVLREALRLLRATLPASIRIEEDIAPTPPVLGDAKQIEQVIINIMTNAAQAIGQAQGRISVGLAPAEGDALRLTIADTGCGMDETVLARIFEPFFTTKRVGEGTGLGLSVAHGIVKEHGGRIEVKSRPGEGTRFDVMLPVSRQNDAAA